VDFVSLSGDSTLSQSYRGILWLVVVTSDPVAGNGVDPIGKSVSKHAFLLVWVSLTLVRNPGEVTSTERPDEIDTSYEKS